MLINLSISLVLLVKVNRNMFLYKSSFISLVFVLLEIFVMMITFILWIDCRQADAAQQQRQREGLLIDKSIEFKASAGSVHCLKPLLLLLGSLKKCDKPSFEQLWASLVHYGSPTTILSTDKTALASLLYAQVFLSLLITFI